MLLSCSYSHATRHLSSVLILNQRIVKLTKKIKAKMIITLSIMNVYRQRILPLIYGSLYPPSVSHPPLDEHIDFHKYVQFGYIFFLYVQIMLITASSIKSYQKNNHKSYTIFLE